MQQNKHALLCISFLGLFGISPFTPLSSKPVLYLGALFEVPPSFFIWCLTALQCNAYEEISLVGWSNAEPNSNLDQRKLELEFMLLKGTFFVRVPRSSRMQPPASWDQAGGGICWVWWSQLPDSSTQLILAQRLRYVKILHRFQKRKDHCQPWWSRAFEEKPSYHDSSTKKWKLLLPLSNSKMKITIMNQTKKSNSVQVLLYFSYAFHIQVNWTLSRLGLLHNRTNSVLASKFRAAPGMHLDVKPRSWKKAPWESELEKKNRKFKFLY